MRRISINSSKRLPHPPSSPAGSAGRNTKSGRKITPDPKIQLGAASFTYVREKYFPPSIHDPLMV
jgi:hypothetical protein